MSKYMSRPVQFNILKRTYPNSHGSIRGNNFNWYIELKPTPISICYKIMITTEDIGKHGDYKPLVYVKSPKPLKLASGKKSLPHVYNTMEQKICLYDWRYAEWNATMPIAYTIVPWASEWLYYYEIWSVTGEWLGGGHHPANNKKTSS